MALPRISALLMLRSTLPTVSAPAAYPFRGSITHPTQLLCTLRGRRCRRLTQHSLTGGPLRPYPDRSFTGWTAPAWLAPSGSWVNRLIEPTAGKIIIDRADICRCDAAALRELRLHKIAMVFQHVALLPHRTVIENVEFGLKTRGLGSKRRRERAMAALDQVGLAKWASERPAT
jgi:hypothetical protein